ncbi:putative sulfate exporter family transporter, partial [Haemophilus influenzae]|uniref:putative sulfate exporter family transporter n=1 Tax=Haemophilus influenzae TaxID=727 RepID=UPI000CB28F01
GSSICGGSAIAATAPVIHAKEKEVAQAISVIFFFNVLAALIFPTLGTWLHLSNDGFALFAGTAVNDTSSVTATVFAVGQSSLPVILSTISIALIVAYLFQRFFALDTKLATLIGVGSSICGGSAIAATAPVIHAKEKEVAQAISVIF